MAGALYVMLPATLPNSANMPSIKRRVEGVRDAQPLRLPADQLGDLEHRRLLAGDDDRVRTVHRRDRHPALERGQAGFDDVGRGLQRHHRAAGGQRVHQPAACRDQSGRVLKREDACRARRDQLADGVAEQVVRDDAPGLHQPEQRQLDREQAGLGEHRPVQQCFVGPEDHVPHRHAQVAVQFGADLVEGRGENRVRLAQLPPHAQALRPLPGEEQGGPAAVRRGHPRHRARRHVLQPGQQLVPVGADHHRAVGERGAGGHQRQADVRRRQLRRPGDQVLQARSLAAQRRRVPAGQHPRHHTGHHGRGRVGRLLGDGRLVRSGLRLLQDHVRVGAADAERGDAGPAGSLVHRPVAGLGQQLHRAGRPVHVRGRLLDVQGPRQHAVLHGHDHLDDAADAGRGLRVADVGLQRPEPERLVRGTVLAVGGEQRPRLDRVAERRAGAVRLDHVHVGRREPALASAWRMTRCCEGPFGAVRPLLAPSWLTAEPRTTASTSWPLRRASDSRSSSTMPTPSAQPCRRRRTRTPCNGRRGTGRAAG